jgi:TolB-like protein
MFSLLLFVSLLGCASRTPVRGISDRALVKKNRATSVPSDLKTKGEASKGWLGVSIQDVTEEITTNLKLKEPTGALIAEVFAGDPAAKAGLKSGDVVTAVNGRKIKTARELLMIVADFRGGENIEVKAFRDGRERTFSVDIERKNETKIVTAARDSKSGMNVPDSPKKSATTGGVMNVSRLSVFNFNAVNLDASKYGPEVTNMLTDTLGKNQAFSIMSRHDLQEFLRLNDLQQNDNLENLINIGSRLGLNFIVTGRIENKGGILVIECTVVNVHEKKVIFTRKVQALGDSNLAAEVIRIGDSIAAVIATSGR